MVRCDIVWLGEAMRGKVWCVGAGVVSYGAVVLDKVRFVGAVRGEVRQVCIVNKGG